MDAAGPDTSEGADQAFHERDKETAMLKLETAIPIACLLTIAFCTPLAVAQDRGGGNAIPYPLKQWQGVQGKTLDDSKPYFVGQPKAPEDAPNVLIISKILMFSSTRKGSPP